MKTKKLAIYGMLAAMCGALGLVSINLGGQKLTFESLPILVGAFLYGPVCGAIVAAVGTFISQLLSYGLMLTTVVWILPYVIFGLAAGIAGRLIGRAGDIKVTSCMVAVTICQLLLTGLNTGAMYVDGLIGGYSASYALATLPLRLLVCAGKSVAFGAILPALVKALKKI